MRFCIGNRVHLAAFITGLYDYDNTTRKFADVLSGKKTRVTLGYPEIAAAKSFGVSPRTKIIVEVSINRNEIYLVTAYNKNNTPTIGCIY